MEQAVEKGAQSFDYEQFDADALDVDALYEAYELMLMLSFKRCLYVVNFEIEALSKQSQEKLLEMLKDPIDTSLLILQTREKDNHQKRQSHGVHPGCKQSRQHSGVFQAHGGPTR